MSCPYTEYADYNIIDKKDMNNINEFICPYAEYNYNYKDKSKNAFNLSNNKENMSNTEYYNKENMSNTEYYDGYYTIENMVNQEDKISTPSPGVKSFISHEQFNVPPGQEPNSYLQKLHLLLDTLFNEKISIIQDYDYLEILHKELDSIFWNNLNQFNPPRPPTVNPDEHNNLKETLKDMYNNKAIFKEKYNKLPKVMFFLSPDLLIIPDGYNPCIYLHGLYTELEKEVGNKIVLTEFSEEKIKNIKHDRILIPAGIDYAIYKMMLRNELTDIISNILKNIPQQSHLPSVNPSYCKTPIECKFAPLKTFNKEIENIDFINTKEIQSYLNEYNKYKQNINYTMKILEKKKTITKNVNKK